MRDLQPPDMQDPLDELTQQLLECGAVLSQIIGRTVDVGAMSSGRS